MKRQPARGRGAVGLSILLGACVALAAWGAAALPPRLRIPRVAGAPAQAPPLAAFSHRGHGRLLCSACHPSVFPMRPLGFRHADMRGGRYCGACHEGARAVAISELKCEVCHDPN